MTQQQHSNRQMIENILLTGQPTLDAAAATEPQHRRISNRLLEIQNFKPPKFCSTLQRYKILHLDTLFQLVTSSTLCIQYKEKNLQLYQIDTSRAGLNGYLNLYCHNWTFYIMLL